MRSDRLGTLGTLAAGLAHEINNPLVSIRTFLSMAPKKRTDEDPEFWCEYHALAFEEVERIRRLVETMRQLGRADGGRAGCEVVDLEKLIGQVIMLVQREARRKNVEISLEVVTGIKELVAVRDQIHQLVMNLVLNALCAAPENGNVWIRVFDDLEPTKVVMEVKDNGEGISEEHLNRIPLIWFNSQQIYKNLLHKIY